MNEPGVIQKFRITTKDGKGYPINICQLDGLAGPSICAATRCTNSLLATG